MFSDSRNKHIFQGGGGRGVRPSFLKKFPSFFLVIYLDRRSEGGGSAVPWYIMIYISLYMLSKYLSILIFFFQSIFFLSICLSIYFFLFIYLQRGGAAVPWYMIIYIKQYMLSKYQSNYWSFFLSIFFPSIYLSIYFFYSYIYISGQKAIVIKTGKNSIQQKIIFNSLMTKRIKTSARNSLPS